MPAQHQFHVLVKYENREWGHSDLADYIAGWIKSGQGSMPPEEQPDITEVTVKRVMKRAAKRPPVRKD